MSNDWEDKVKGLDAEEAKLTPEQTLEATLRKIRARARVPMGAPKFTVVVATPRMEAASAPRAKAYVLATTDVSETVRGDIRDAAAKGEFNVFFLEGYETGFENLKFELVHGGEE